MSWRSLLGLLVGAAALVFLARAVDLQRLGAVLMAVGWRIAPVIALHPPQTLFATAGWRAVLRGPSPGLARLFLFRWIKEAANALLPVGQVGGDVARARLLSRDGVGMREAVASCTVDVAVGTLCLFTYLAAGAGVLLARSQGHSARTVASAVIAGAAGALLLALAPRFGALKLIEAMLARLGGDGLARRGAEKIRGLHEAVVELYRDRKRMAWCAAHHLLAWSFGTLETMAGLWALGLHPSLGEAFLVDSLGQGARAAGFAIPGALGVQEGGYVLVCSLVGIPAPEGLALSLLKRGREIGLGLPALLAWPLIRPKTATR